MYNKLLRFVQEQGMLQPGDRLVCALSGGADSVAMLFAFYLLKEQLDIRLEAAHFDHQLRGEESRRDADFAREFCGRYDIPLHMGSGEVKPGKKGLEAAARDARYAFLKSLGGKIATAHTADDNGETILMHLIRGTGLKGLGGIAPIQGNLIRPMLTITRREVEAFLEEWSLPHVHDSSNDSDTFLRNRLRHQVMPLLKQENPRLAENLTRMALGLRQDEALLEQLTGETLPPVAQLRQTHPALQTRMLARFLKQSGVREPEERHIAAVRSLLENPNPSARVDLPGGVTVARRYERLEVLRPSPVPEAVALPCPGQVQYGAYLVTCAPAEAIRNDGETFTVVPKGEIWLTPRREGDALRLPGGSKSLKKLYIDRKIPAAQRPHIPVVRDAEGILGVYSIGVNRDREVLTLPACSICIKQTKEGE